MCAVVGTPPDCSAWRAARGSSADWETGAVETARRELVAALACCSTWCIEVKGEAMPALCACSPHSRSSASPTCAHAQTRAPQRTHLIRPVVGLRPRRGVQTDAKIPHTHTRLMLAEAGKGWQGVGLAGAGWTTATVVRLGRIPRRLRCRLRRSVAPAARSRPPRRRAHLEAPLPVQVLGNHLRRQTQGGPRAESRLLHLCAVMVARCAAQACCPPKRRTRALTVCSVVLLHCTSRITRPRSATALSSDAHAGSACADTPTNERSGPGVAPGPSACHRCQAAGLRLTPGAWHLVPLRAASPDTCPHSGAPERRASTPRRPRPARLLDTPQDPR